MKTPRFWLRLVVLGLSACSPGPLSPGPPSAYEAAPVSRLPPGLHLEDDEPRGGTFHPEPSCSAGSHLALEVAWRVPPVAGAPIALEVTEGPAPTRASVTQPDGTTADLEVSKVGGGWRLDGPAWRGAGCGRVVLPGVHVEVPVDVEPFSPVDAGLAALNLEQQGTTAWVEHRGPAAHLLVSRLLLFGAPTGFDTLPSDARHVTRFASWGFAPAALGAIAYVRGERIEVRFGSTVLASEPVPGTKLAVIAAASWAAPSTNVVVALSEQQDRAIVMHVFRVPFPSAEPTTWEVTTHRLPPDLRSVHATASRLEPDGLRVALLGHDGNDAVVALSTLAPTGGWRPWRSRRFGAASVPAGRPLALAEGQAVAVVLDEGAERLVGVLSPDHDRFAPVRHWHGAGRPHVAFAGGEVFVAEAHPHGALRQVHPEAGSLIPPTGAPLRLHAVGHRVVAPQAEPGPNGRLFLHAWRPRR